MKPQLIYDFPTRLFHWIFSALFLVSFVIAKLFDDDNPIFSFHMLSGLTLSFLVILRILWGFFGTRHARFSNFALNPTDLVKYFKGIMSGSLQRWAGHNPASSWAAIAMIALALCLGLTGYLMTSGGKSEVLEDIHAIFAYLFLVTVLMHVAGIVLHTIRHKEVIGLSMIHGKKDNFPETESIGSARPLFGLLLVGLVVVFGFNLYKNYDQQNRKLNFFGTSLQLGENENENESGEEDED